MNKLSIIYFVLAFTLVFSYFWKYIYSTYYLNNDKNRELIYENFTWDLYFTPWFGFDEYRDIINNITTKEMRVYIYTFTYDKIIKLFQKLWDFWVDIKIIAENNQYWGWWWTYEKLLNKLLNHWIKIKNDSDMWTNYVHAKTIIFDDYFIVQSSNFTYSFFYKNREFVFKSWYSPILISLKKIFDKDWKWEEIDESIIHNNLLVCDINCRDHIEKILKSAEKSILIHTQYLSDDRIINILNSKKNIDLKIIVWDNQEIEDINILDWKYKILEKYYNHNKSILVDDKYLILWSMNLSTNSLDKNREIWIVTVNNDTISQYKKMFFWDWNSIE